jgi:hypothetical protein
MANCVDKISSEKAAIQNNNNQKAGTKRSADLRLDVEYLIMMNN